MALDARSSVPRRAGVLRGAALAGAAVTLSAGRALDPAALNRTALVLGGAAYGLVLAALLRISGQPPRMWPLVGALCAPVLPALYLDNRWNSAERLGLLAAAAVLGAIVGLLESARIGDPRKSA